MALVGSILQEILKLKKRIRKSTIVYDERLQEKTLKKLLTFSRNTKFGYAYDFKGILRSENMMKEFQRKVPLYDYNKIFDQWWHRTLAGEEDVCWPGKTKYFALTSGTTDSASKRVPVTKEMLKAIRKVSIRQMLTIPDLNFPPEFYTKHLLLLGGSTKLTKIKAGFEGDLSGITQHTLPAWVLRFYKPGKKIASIKDWNQKLNTIAKEAHHWDVAIACGVPAWYQLLFEEILKVQQIKNIHEIWPNFNIFVHGGVSFTPYRESFKKYLGKDIYYLDTYLASEGFLAYQSADNKLGMQLVLDNWIFFEFIPFNENNFTADGQLKENPEVLLITEVKENVDYALILSTCSGAWRYMIGDTIRFMNLKTFEIVITGRTKHFLSLCGEHLSVDNMNQALQKVSNEMGFEANEYTVAGIPYEGSFAHYWYIGTNKEVNNEELKIKLDLQLKELNDDYATERKHALKEVFVQTIPTSLFYSFMEKRGKLGGQNKFPRVMKSNMLVEWQKHVEQTLAK